MLVEFITSIVLLVASLYAWLYHIRPRLVRPALLRIPYIGGHWLKGSVTTLKFPMSVEDLCAFFAERSSRFGPVQMFKVMWFQQVRLVTPDAIKVVAQSNVNIRKSAVYDNIMHWLGISLLTSTGKQWKVKRRMLTPAFHFKILQDYARVNIEQTNLFLDLMANASRGGEFVEVQGPVGRLTLDIIVRTAFDCTFSAQLGDPAALAYLDNINELSHESFRSFQNGSAMLPWWLFSTLTPGGKRYAAAIRKLHAFTLRVIQERKEQIAKGMAGRKPYEDFLQTVLESKYEDGTAPTEEDIRAEVDTFMFEGHDTTSAGISWILYSLAAHPEVQEKCRKEVLATLGSGPRTVITHEELGAMTYLTAAIKEALRLYPPVPFISRTLDEGVEIAGYYIPAGSNVSIAPIGVHYNPAVWPNPHLYQPERFLGDGEDRHSYSFIPFSAGPRNCIGQVFAMNEMKMVAAMVLRRFRISADPKRKVLLQPMIIMRAADGIWLKFEDL